MNNEAKAAAWAQHADRMRAQTQVLTQQSVQLVSEARGIRDTVSGMLGRLGVAHRWVGARLDLMLPDGTYATGVELQGVQGVTGPAPTLVMGTVGTLSSGSSATAELVEIAAGAYRLDMSVPEGIQGLEGSGDVSHSGTIAANDIAAFTDTTGGTIKSAGVKVSTDGTLAGNSDLLIPTQKAVKTYADGLIAAADAMVFKGTIDCSANPNYPAADRGATYRVSVSGKIGGGSGTNVEVGDLLICLTDGTSAGNQATVGASWTISQTNLDGAVIGPASVTDSRLAAFDGTTGKLLKDSGKLISDLATQADLAAVSVLIPRSSRTSNTILGTADKGKVIDVTGASTFTQTLTAAATLAAGWWCEYRNSGTGIVTIDPSSSETIDGRTTINVYPGESFTIECNGTDFVTVGRSSLALVTSQVASAAAAVDFAAGLADTEFTSFEIEFSNLTFSGSDTLALRLSQSGSFVTSSSYNSEQARFSTTTPTAGASAGTASIPLENLASAGTNVRTGAVKLFQMASAVASVPAIRASLYNSVTAFAETWGTITTAAAIDGVRLFCTSGATLSGTFKMFGRRG
jgi:hypothetical protein